MVLGVLGGDALFNRLRAFELRASIEETALLAAVQLELALGTFAVGIKTRGEDGATIGAARAGDGSHHARCAGAELVGAARAARWRFFFVRALALLTFLRVAVTAMTILTIHKRLRPPALTDCNGYNLNLARNDVPTWLVSNWIATLGRTALCLPEFALQCDVVREQEMGPLCF